MFRSRSHDKQAAAPQETAELPKQPRDPQAPKGRPTPKRREAQAARRSLTKPPADRKEAARRAREARRAELARQREALAGGGDERYLPPRDRGPVRRYARDFVDSRWHVAEFFLPIAVVILAMSVMNSLQVKNIAFLLWMGVIVMIAVDSFVTSRKLKKALRERFPNENRRGAVAYALMRTLQMRRMRLPKPQVARGEAPRR